MNNQERLDQITRELAAREPIFHRPEFATSRGDVEAMTASDFWEVGASGRVYSREFVLDTIEQRHRSPTQETFDVTDFACRCIGDDVYLVTYRLEQDGGRISRRATVWRRSAQGWKILYHQGTLISTTS